MKLNWLESKPASILFLYSVIAFWSFIALLLLFQIPGATELLNTSHRASQLFGDPFFALGNLAVLSMPVIFFGMAVYCLFADHSSTGIDKFFWFLLFLATGPIGSTVYYFVVYRRRLKRKTPHGADLVNSQF